MNRCRPGGLLFVICLSLTLQAGQADEATAPSTRDRIDESVAGNDDVARIMRTFDGKGEVGDDSQPTPADEAVTLFQLADGLRVELVAAEPVVEQPLSMHFDSRGRLWVVEYRQYPFPEGLKVIRYDQYLRAVFDKVPLPPPHGVKGRDRITVFTDTDGDGTYDHHQVAIDGLNITSSVLTGENGIWVLNPPYLLFYPDADKDTVPDGDPEVHLSGFGLEDTHSVANSLNWGPDGWIYGANGSTTTGNVSSAVNSNIRFEGQCIWRYHPRTRVFEIYAEGGGNTFSTEIDAAGRVFSGTNHGNTRGMYYPQGSYGEKNWGKHGPLTNPYAFGFFRHMQHEGDKDRFAQTFVIYEGATLPERYHRSVIAANALHNRVWASQLIPVGSTYRTVDMPEVMTTPDRWFRPVDLKVGPDGAVYLADWYDTRLTHVDPRDNWHKTSGRVYRIVPTTDESQKAQSRPHRNVLASLTSSELLHLFDHPGKWHSQTAVRVLSERLSADPETPDALRIRPQLEARLAENAAGALESLWVLQRVWPEAFLQHAPALLRHPHQDVRRWAVRLIGDWRTIGTSLAAELAALIEREQDVQVLCQLASSIRRLHGVDPAPLLLALAARPEMQSDPHYPLLVWWAFETQIDPLRENPQLGVRIEPVPDAAASSRQQILAALVEADAWQHPGLQDVILPRLMQRFAMEGVTPASQPTGEGTSPIARPAGFAACEDLFTRAPDDASRGKLISGLMQAFEGREITGLPPSLARAIDDYQTRIGSSDLALSLKLGKPEAVTEALKTIRNESADPATRLAYLDLLGQIDAPQVVSPLLGLLGSPSPAIKRAAMRTLMKYDDPKIGQTICSRYHSSLPAEHDLRSTAQRVLASRPVWTKQFLAEIDAFRIKPDTVPLDIVQQMRLHDDPEIQKRLDQHWGRTRATPEEKQQQIERLVRLLTNPDESASPADAVQGRELFRKHCSVCHTLFDEGGQTGPVLTGYERDNLQFMLLAIVDPSAAIREEFTQFQAVTTDGLVLNGLLDEQTPTTITLRGANNQSTQLNRDDVEILKAVETSLMPDGLMDKLTDDEVRHLFAYLTRRTPLTD